MDNESNQVQNEIEKSSISRATIEVPVPANNPDLYRYEVTNDLLRFLIDRPFKEYSLRKLSALLDRSHRSVGKAVDVLAENGLLSVISKGNKKLIGINRERITTPDEPTLRIPQSEFHEPVREARERLLEELDEPLGIEVYGSVARGQADRQSDIDLWILVRENRGRAQAQVQDIANDLANEAINGNRYDFHMVVETPESVPAYTEEIGDIVRSGITVFETEDFNKFRSIMEGMIDDE